MNKVCGILITLFGKLHFDLLLVFRLRKIFLLTVDKFLFWMFSCTRRHFCGLHTWLFRSWRWMLRGKPYRFSYIIVQPQHDKVISFFQVPGLPQRIDFWTSNELCSVANGDLFHVTNLTEWLNLNTFLVGLGITCFITNLLFDTTHWFFVEWSSTFIHFLQATPTPTGLEWQLKATQASGLQDPLEPS